jgi:hypothetical protein
MLQLALSLWLCAPFVSASRAGTPGGQGRGPRRATQEKEYVRQEEVVSFARAGRVRVRAVEVPRTRPRLEFIAEKTGRRLLSLSVGASDARAYRIESYATPMNPLVRFKVLEAAGLPGPLVFAVAVKPGGTDHGFETNLVAETGGRLKVLNSAPLTNNIQGGVFVGDLGAGRGPGVAVWNFLWEEEAHYGAHRYEVRLLPFDARAASFRRGGRLRTKGKHANGRDALAELGLPRYANLLDEMPSIAEYRRH